MSLLNLAVVQNPNKNSNPEFSFLPGYIKNIPYKYSTEQVSTITQNIGLTKKIEAGNLRDFPDSILAVDSVLNSDIIINPGQSGLGVHLSYSEYNIETSLESQGDLNKQRITKFINL